MAQYGMRTRDGSGVTTLDTSTTSIRSLKMLQVTGNGQLDQYFSIPEIRAGSFVVVDTLEDFGNYTWSPQAWYSEGQLHLRRAYAKTWQVMILSQGSEPFESVQSYGIRTLNNNIRTQIDSVNRVLSIRYSGKFTFEIPSRGLNIEGDNFLTFPAPITTTERPLVFLNANDYLMVGQFRVVGSPGNWTGFRVADFRDQSHGPGWNQPIRISWYCASYMAIDSSDGVFGARIRDSSGKTTFNTNANLALLNSQPSIDGFVTRGPAITRIDGYYASSQQTDWTGNYQDYFLANALLSSVNIAATSQPFRANFGGFLPGNRSILQMYSENPSGINPVTPNGRTFFASRPMKPL